jgi:hypothetical protein
MEKLLLIQRGASCIARLYLPPLAEQLNGSVVQVR